MFGVCLCDSEIAVFISGIQQVFNYVEGKESGEGRGKKKREEVGGEGRRQGRRNSKRPAGQIREDWVLHGDWPDKAGRKLNAASLAMPANFLGAWEKPFHIKLCCGLPVGLFSSLFF